MAIKRREQGIYRAAQGVADCKGLKRMVDLGCFLPCVYYFHISPIYHQSKDSDWNDLLPSLEREADIVHTKAPECSSLHLVTKQFHFTGTVQLRT